MKFKLPIYLLLCVIVQPAIIYYFYPWEGYEGIHWSPQLKTISYITISAISFLLTAILIPLLFRLLRSRLTRIQNSMLCSVASMMVFTILSVGFGPYGWEIPGTRVGAMFFMEWTFLNFMIKIGPIFSLLSGLAEFFRVYSDR